MTTIVAQPTQHQTTNSGYRCVLEYEGERLSSYLAGRSATSETARQVEQYLQARVCRRLMDQGLFLLVGFLECGIIPPRISWYPARPGVTITEETRHTS